MSGEAWERRLYRSDQELPALMRFSCPILGRRAFAELGPIESRENVPVRLESQAVVEWPHIGVDHEQDPPH